MKNATNLTSSLPSLIEISLFLFKLAYPILLMNNIVPISLETHLSVAVAVRTPITRKGITELLNESGCTVIASCENGCDVKSHLEALGKHPQVCIIETDTCEETFFAIEDINNRWPDVRVLAFTSITEEYHLLKIIKAGASGCIPKNSPLDEIRKAVIDVYFFGHYFSKFEIEKILASNKRSLYTANLFTKSEIEFLKLSCTELTYKEIAEKMNVSLRIVDSFRDELFSKIGVSSRIGLVIFAFKNGLL